MTLSRLTGLTREVLLTFTAVVGGLCVLLTAIGFAFGIHPLLFRSGSMSPTISTGDIAFSHSVAAARVRKGDIVSVIADSGARVTHRVVDSTGSGSHRLLTLKGDANQVIDPKVYDVTSVQRVLFHVPKVGYAVSWLSSAPGVYLVAAYVALMLLLIGRSAGDPKTPREPTDDAEATSTAVEIPRVETREPMRTARRPVVGAVSALAVLGAVFAAVLVWAMPTWAAWTSSVPVTGQSLTTGTWGAPPAPTGVTCTAGTTVANTIKISWTAVSGATNYVVTRNPGTQLSGSATSQTFTGGNNTTGTAFVQAQIGSGPLSANSTSINYTFGNGNNKAPVCN
ncbi:MAG: signal peptidase [Marmoricola sp.]|nr:signal peptidase [Marmoricola sp.]